METTVTIQEKHLAILLALATSFVEAMCGNADEAEVGIGGGALVLRDHGKLFEEAKGVANALVSDATLGFIVGVAPERAAEITQATRVLERALKN